MNSQELRNLQKAYIEVVENQQINEGFNEKGEFVRDKPNTAPPNPRKPKPIYPSSSISITRTPEQIEASRTPEQRDEAEKQRQKRIKLAQSLLKNPQEQRNIILTHLLDEGYAETLEAAETIMVNMSEDWRNSIIG